jgi:hypothetical protein
MRLALPHTLLPHRRAFDVLKVSYLPAEGVSLGSGCWVAACRRRERLRSGNPRGLPLVEALYQRTDDETTATTSQIRFFLSSLSGPGLTAKFVRHQAGN